MRGPKPFQQRPVQRVGIALRGQPNDFSDVLDRLYDQPHLHRLVDVRAGALLEVFENNGLITITEIGQQFLAGAIKSKEDFDKVLIEYGFMQKLFTF